MIYRNEVKEWLIGFLKIEAADSEKERKNLLDTEIKKITEEIKTLETKTFGKAWVFSKEKQMNIFATNGKIWLIPFNSYDQDNYINIHRQYVSAIHDYDNEEYRDASFNLIMGPEGFYCGIYLADNRAMIGYVGIIDTTKNLWELVIELDSAYRYQGIGGEALNLFMKAISEITKKNQFCVFVEYDNSASRSMFEKLGARIIGIANKLYPSLSVAENYEEKHLDEITSDMEAVAKTLDIESRKLLSHVLEYNIGVS